MILRSIANAGVAAAQFNLGVMHDFGQGVPKNPQEAARWYRAAAPMASPNASTISATTARVRMSTALP